MNQQYNATLTGVYTQGDCMNHKGESKQKLWEWQIHELQQCKKKLCPDI